jgi:hypothetical protein
LFYCGAVLVGGGERRFVIGITRVRLSGELQESSRHPVN